MITIIILGLICIGILVAEMIVFAPDKLPWNKKKEK